jgi:hypothetical protein
LLVRVSCGTTIPLRVRASPITNESALPALADQLRVPGQHFPRRHLDILVERQEQVALVRRPLFVASSFRLSSWRITSTDRTAPAAIMPSILVQSVEVELDQQSDT